MELITYLNDLRKMQGLPVNVFKSSEVDFTFIGMIATLIVLLFLMVILIVMCVFFYKKIIQVNWAKSAISNQGQDNDAKVQQKTLDLLETGKINPQECAELLGAVSETKEQYSQQETQTPEH
jgi:uncharacterized membrane protein